jgi:hypothetical protein
VITPAGCALIKQSDVFPRNVQAAHLRQLIQASCIAEQKPAMCAMSAARIGAQSRARLDTQVAGAGLGNCWGQHSWPGINIQDLLATATVALVPLSH